MKQYVFQMNTIAGSPAWQFEGSQPSDQMALDYAQRIVAHNMTGCRFFMSLTVWRKDGEQDYAFVGTIRLNEPTTSCDRETP